MNATGGNHGINHLARTLQSRMERNQNARSTLMLDFGSIQPDYSLLTNTYPIPIPKRDYMVCRQLTLGSVNLLPGDRVLVAWVQNDAIVVDLVLPATVL